MKFIFFTTVWFFMTNLQSQNLILNGDFEDFIRCPKGLNYQEKSMNLRNVTNPNQGSFDFIHTCDDENFPRFYWGNQEPQKGEGFVGISVYKYQSISNDEGREYLQIEIKDSLIKGKIYRFEMFVSLADKYNVSINNLGVYFADSLTKIKHNMTIGVKPDILSSDFYKNKNGWDLYSGDYIANGGEKYIIIGNFLNNKYTKAQIINNDEPGKDNPVYYFIDNVSLKENTNLSEGIILNNIQFKTASTELSKSSIKEINKVASFLNLNKNYKVEIVGYTDNHGNETTNTYLSQNRAKEVAKYLIKNGIDSNRIKPIGLGSKHPIGDNNIEEGKYKNRRVELKFY